MTSKILFGKKLNKEFQISLGYSIPGSLYGIGKPYVVVLLTITIQLSGKPTPNIF
jgi:hypothetical protein